jgi:hypothetical protein
VLIAPQQRAALFGHLVRFRQLRTCGCVGYRTVLPISIEITFLIEIKPFHGV